MHTRLVIAAGLFLLAPVAAQGQELLVVFDARPTPVAGDGPRDVTAAPAAIAAFPWKRIGAMSSEGCEKEDWKSFSRRLDHLGRALACATLKREGEVPADTFRMHSQMVRGAAASVAAIVEANKGSSSLRTTAGKGDEVKVAVIQAGMEVTRKVPGDKGAVDVVSCPVKLLARPVDVTINAKPRASQIAADIKALMQIAFRIAGAGAGTKSITDADCTKGTETHATPVDLVTLYGFRLPIARATVEIEVNADAAPSIPIVVAAQPAGAAALSDPTVPASVAVKPKATLLTGPGEHFFLAGDIPLNGTKAEDYSYNEATGAVDVASKPASYHLSVNWLPFGDLLGERRFLENFYVKGLIAASNRPLSSYGVGLGFRGVLGKKGILSFDTVSPYAAFIWTRSDSIAGPSIQHDRKTVREGRFGASLNLEKVLGWLK